MLGFDDIVMPISEQQPWHSSILFEVEILPHGLVVGAGGSALALHLQVVKKYEAAAGCPFPRQQSQQEM